ncbi:MAG: YfiR family protein [Salinivirgaceae bacterium]
MKKLIVIFLLFGSIVASAQNADIAKYKAMFVLNFIRYIGWPDASKEGDFVIGVVKESGIAGNLKGQTVGKKFGFQTIVIKEFNSVEEITDCQLLFFSNNQNFSRNAQVVIDKLNNSNSLIVTEVEGAVKDGSMINFVVRDEKLKFEISAANAEKFGLKFSSALTSLSNAIVK